MAHCWPVDCIGHNVQPRKKSILSFVFCLVFAGPGFPAWAGVTDDGSPAAKDAEGLRRYVIGPGDLLQISVWKEPDASVPAVVVRSDGAISLPLIKEVQAAGLTPKELEEVLADKFKQVIRDVDVTVLVKEIHSEKIYMVGAVRKEGLIPMTASLTILQAIAEAGGLTDYAKRNKVYVLRNEGAKQTRIQCDYESAMKGSPESNIQLRPGDTVIVP